MILSLPTYRRFGYWPEDLNIRSKVGIIRKCDECGIIDVISRSNRNTQKCKKCRISPRRTSNLCLYKSESNLDVFHRSLLNAGKFSYKMLVDMFYSTSIRNTTASSKIGKELTKRFRITMSYSFARSYGYGRCLYMSRTKTLAIMNFLDLNDGNITKESFKAALEKKILNDIPFRSLSYILEKRKAIIYSGKNVESIYISDTAGLISKLFEVLNFKCISKRGTTRLLSGSLFIDGRWVHVG